MSKAKWYDRCHHVTCMWYATGTSPRRACLRFTAACRGVVWCCFERFEVLFPHKRMLTKRVSSLPRAISSGVRGVVSEKKLLTHSVPAIPGAQRTNGLRFLDALQRVSRYQTPISIGGPDSSPWPHAYAATHHVPPGTVGASSSSWKSTANRPC